MKIPAKPPKLEDLWSTALERRLYIALSSLGVGPVTEKGEYLHWDQLRAKQPRPYGFSAEEWWIATKIARRALYKRLPFADIRNEPFLLAIPDILWQKIYEIDRPLQAITDRANSENSLEEEAISSSQLEGAATTRKVAKEMIRTRRKPRTKDEQMILNNYHAMQYIREIKDQPLSEEIILTLHQILTEKTLKHPKDEGQLRKTNDIEIVDEITGDILHSPPKAHELKERLKRICVFANEAESRLPKYNKMAVESFLPMEFHIKAFIHPLIRGIILHFMLAYNHPFVDGNGRTARALFYWYMARQGYTFIEMISISQIIKEAPMQYARAFLYTETDENDVTYFVFHQINIILKAWNRLVEYTIKQKKEIHKIEQKLRKYPLNYRQLGLIRHAIKNPQTQYLIEAHRQANRITYDTARTDLLKLEELGLLEKKEIGKRFVFIPTRKCLRLPEH
jgi:Fic family protein